MTLTAVMSPALAPGASAAEGESGTAEDSGSIVNEDLSVEDEASGGDNSNEAGDLENAAEEEAASEGDAEAEAVEQEIIPMPNFLGLSGAYWKINYSSSRTFYLSGGTMKGVDVSYWQGKIDWKAVKNAGIGFALIRIGYGKSGTDSRFEGNVKGAVDNGIPYGVYIYSTAKSESDVKAEAKHTMALLKGYYPDLPVYYDLEDKCVLKGAKYSKTTITKWARLFCRTLTANGYKAGVYANLSWHQKYIDGASLKNEGYDLWLAQWPIPGNGQEKVYSSLGHPSGRYSTWQCSIKGQVKGISGKVDTNLLVIPYSGMKSFMEYKSIPGETAVNEQEMRICLKSVPARTGPGQGFKPDGSSLTFREAVTICAQANGYVKLTDGRWIPKSSVVTPETPWAFDPERDGALYSYGDELLTDRWVSLNGSRYYVDSLGKPLTGRQVIDDNEYWFNDEGVLQAGRFMEIDGIRCYLDADGLRVRNRVVSAGGYYYGFDEDGAMLSGTSVWFGCKRYTFDSKGRAYISKSKTIRKGAYYKKPGSGKMGTIKKGKNFYVLRTSGKWSQMSNGYWVKTSCTKKIAKYPTYKPETYTKYDTKITKKTSAYSGPKTNYIKKKTLKRGTKVTVTGTYGSWAKLSKGYWVPKSRLQQGEMK